MREYSTVLAAAPQTTSARQRSLRILLVWSAALAGAALTTVVPASATSAMRAAATMTGVGVFAQYGSKVTAGDEDGSAELGGRVAVSGDGNTALVGGWGDSHFQGAAWVFTRTDGVWSQQGPKLVPNNLIGQAHFGLSVALSANGDTALIGGYLDNGVGAAWVFTRSGETWTQRAKIAANDQVGGGFGANVALSADGTTAAVIAPFYNNYSGAAWMFTRSGNTWSQQGPRLTVNDETRTDEAGGAGLGPVALSADGNTALIGGTRDNGFAGAAWAFVRSGQAWSQLGAKFTPNDESSGRSEFGSGVALSADGSTALIGGPSDDNFGGAAWTFSRFDSTWVQQGAKLTPDEPSSYRYFGASVTLSADGKTAAIGAPFDNNYQGAAWTFARSDNRWIQQNAKLAANDGTGQSELGSVALAGDGSTLLIGGSRDNNYIGAMWAFSRLLVGSMQVQPGVDSNPSGVAEAFRYTAPGSGPAAKLSIYLDGTSTATSVIVGLYTNTGAGNPGTLLGYGTITNPRAGAWNTVTIPAVSVTSNSDYWLAVLSPRKAGIVKFRDAPAGAGGPTQTSSQTSLASLPSTWRTGTRFSNSPASFYAAP